MGFLEVCIPRLVAGISLREQTVKPSLRNSSTTVLKNSLILGSEPRARWKLRTAPRSERKRITSHTDHESAIRDKIISLHSFKGSFRRKSITVSRATICVTPCKLMPLRHFRGHLEKLSVRQTQDFNTVITGVTECCFLTFPFPVRKLPRAALEGLSLGYRRRSPSCRQR